jgi:hypothetical protein
MTTQEKIKIETHGIVIINDWECVESFEFGDWFAYAKFSLN